MISPAGLADLWWLTRRVEEHAVPGAVVQCGVWRGGGAAIMARASRRSSRPLWLFDSFEGFPEPTEEDRPGVGISAGAWAASVDDAREAMRRVGVDSVRVSVVPGPFDTTLPLTLPAIGPIALLSIDAVLYSSVKVSLETLYDQVVTGGLVILDDYGYWPGCRRAVHEFISRRAATARLQSTATAAYWFEKLP
jgi:O-methyltransferase